VKCQHTISLKASGPRKARLRSSGAWWGSGIPLQLLRVGHTFWKLPSVPTGVCGCPCPREEWVHEQCDLTSGVSAGLQVHSFSIV